MRRWSRMPHLEAARHQVRRRGLAAGAARTASPSWQRGAADGPERRWHGRAKPASSAAAPCRAGVHAGLERRAQGDRGGAGGEGCAWRRARMEAHVMNSRVVPFGGVG